MGEPKPHRQHQARRPHREHDRPRGAGHAPRHDARRNAGPSAGHPGDRVRLYGIHTVEAALANPDRRIHRLMLTEGAGRRLESAVTARGITAETTEPRELDRLLGADTVHQGACLETELLEEPDLFALAANSAAGKGPIVVLDQVTDPHNVGAILRSAAVFGATGLVMTRRHSPPLDGTLAKSASGALELVPIALVQNLSRALAELEKLEVRRVGLDGEAETLIEDQPLSGAVALVLGAEGKGLRQLTRETCDSLVRIGAAGPLASLNVSNAAAVALHMAALQRRRAIA